MSSPLRQPNRSVLLAAIVSVLFACLLTWPVVLSPSTVLVGHPGNDTWNHVWGYWWVGEALKNGMWPIQADKLAYPVGGTLYFIDTMQALFSWPIQLLFGAEVAFNVVMIAQIALSGFAAWLLARKVTGDSIASFCALFLFQMAPHLLGQAYNGISETVCAGWFPLTLWALLRMMEVPTIKRSVTVGIIGGMCILTSWYYGLFAFLGALIILSWHLVKRGWLYEWKSIAVGLVVATLTALIAIIGPLLSFRSSLQAENAIVTRDPEFVERSLLNHNITDLLAFVNPTKTPSPDLFALYGEQLLIVLYVGWIAIALSVYAIFFSRKTQELSSWLWLMGIFFIFCLGPYLNVGGDYVLLSGKKIPLPFLPLYKALPIFDRISHPFRFVTGVNLVLAILASQGMRLLLRNRREAEKIGVMTLLCGALWIEYSFFSPAHLPIPHSSSHISQAYYDMKTDPVDGAVLDLPLSVPNLERAVYVWNQSVHERPIPWGLNDPMPMALQKNLLTKTLVQIEASRALTLPSMLPELDLVVSSRNLARLGYRYIVVHQKMYPMSKSKQTVELLTGLFGEPTAYESDQILVYTVKQI